ncbi:MAG: S1C family serine protease [Oscillospiraceae bacterium]|nr:S1C family serine protease [Oscillospiraceae bacterium]
MDNFLKDNRDYYYRTANYENTPDTKNVTQKSNPKKKKARFAVAVAACLTVMALGISGGAFGVYLLSIPVPEQIAGEENVIATRPQLTANPTAEPKEQVKPTENMYLITSDTLVENNNTTAFSPAELFEVVRDGVVGIEISFTTGGRFSPVEENVMLVGGGFIFTTDGYVLTNDHVIEGADSVYVIVDDYNDRDITHRYEAEVIGSDQGTDIAVLKITRDEAFKALPIGDSSTLRVGTFVSPVGYPLGLEKSMTYGIISGLNREFVGGGYELNSIQFDAAVNSGNSGGPLFDMYGSVVGIVNKKLVFENKVDNIGLAITINDAKPIINDLLLYGMVMSRPMLGITPQVLNEYTAAMFGVDVTSGIFVRGINPMAPAFKSDLLVGDIITEINGNVVSDVTDVQSAIKNNKPGDIVELTVVRYDEAGNRRTATVEIELANGAELVWD